MPTSRSPSRGTKPAAARAASPAAVPAQPSRSYWPIALIGIVAVLGVIVAVLPASLITHFLPPAVRAEDFSGSLWHGSAGHVRIASLDAGAVEWHLHPAALLAMTVAVDLHWVKVGFVIDAAAQIDRHGLDAHDIKGGGPIADLRDFGVAPGWRGTADVDFSELKTDFSKPLAAAGDVRVSNLASAQFAQGADLGGYDLHLGEGAVDADGNAAAKLSDTGGGPLDLQALIHYSSKDRTGTLSGTLKEREGASPALRQQIDNLAQLRGRNAQGRVPVDLEVAL